MSKGRGAWSLENVGAPFKSYIKEKKRERRLGRALTNKVYKRSLAWGQIMERYVLGEKLRSAYTDMNNYPRLEHSDINCWTGKPDTLREGDIVGDMKNPYTLTAFCDLVDHVNSVGKFKEKHSDYYWQLVSNSVLMDVTQAELIYHVPYENEFTALQKYIDEYEAKETDPFTNFQIKWISDEIQMYFDSGEEPCFPYLPNDSEYNDLYQYTFTVPTEDKEALTERVKMAQKILEA